MSDFLNWEAISDWASAVFIQVGAALWRLWEFWKSEDSMETGYERVQRGETVAGWKSVIAAERIPEQYKESVRISASHTLVMPPWRNDANDIHSEFMEYSVLMNFTNHPEEPGGLSVYELYQYSLIADVDTAIARIYYRQWQYNCTCFVSRRVVAVVFHSTLVPLHFRLILVDIAKKRHRSILVEAPIEIFGIQWSGGAHTVRRHDSSMKKLTILYGGHFFNAADPNTDHNIFCEVTYAIPTIDVDPNEEIKPSSQDVPFIASDIIVHPIIRHSGFPPVIIAIGENGPVIPCDHPNKWQITPGDQWLTAFRSTQFGRQFIDAGNALRSLSHFSPTQHHSPPSIAHIHEMLYGYENGDAVFTITMEGYVMRRWINPPSLKYLAAEAVCRAHPEASISELKDRIGFDIFDGMTDENGEALIIYL